MSTKTYTKVVQSDPELLPELEDFIVQVAQEAKMNESKINSLALSFSEAISNSMRHGNRFDINKTVTISVTIDESRMIISLKDQGKGFSLDTVPDPTKPENILKDSGRGIHIMRNFLDNLRYNFTPTGTEVILELSLQ